MAIAPPDGVIAWDEEYGAKAARRNAILAIYGKAKTGKSDFCTKCTGPLYYAHFDPNDNLDAQLLSRAKTYEGPAHVIKCPPIPYKLLTTEAATEYVTKLEKFAAWARSVAREAEERGERGGVFVIDGGRRLKGYIEKMILGESATLGYRASAGERSGVSQIQYAESNTYLADIINAFVGSALHLVVTFEGKDEWKMMADESGKRKRQPTGKVQTTMPQNTSFSINAQIEALVEEVPVIVNNQRQGSTFEHKLRLDYVGFDGMGHLRGRTLPNLGLDALLDLMYSNIPAEAVLDEPHEIQRVDMEGFVETEDDE